MWRRCNRGSEGSERRGVQSDVSPVVDAQVALRKVADASWLRSGVQEIEGATKWDDSAATDGLYKYLERATLCGGKEGTRTVSNAHRLTLVTSGLQSRIGRAKQLPKSQRVWRSN
jgi:hypothetical protein